MKAARWWVGCALTIMIVCACVNGTDSRAASSTGRATSAAKKQMNKTMATHLSIDDTIGDLLEHPAFAGFSRLLPAVG